MTLIQAARVSSGNRRQCAQTPADSRFSGGWFHSEGREKGSEKPIVNAT
jgi:hypothetical protein